MDEALQIPGLRPEGCSTLLIRRLHAGELSGDEIARTKSHVASCRRCAETLAELERETAALPKEIPFDRFAARTLEKAHPPLRRRIPWAGMSMALAASLAIVVVAGPVRHALFGSDSHRNAHKGGGFVELYVGGNGVPPRLAGDREALAPGERVRVGYEVADHKYVAVVSVDESGQVTPLYPESGKSLRAETTPGMHVLPDSVEFTGAGYERVITLFSDQPLTVESISGAAKKAFEKAGSVEGMGPLDIPGEQTSKLVRKQ
jgi:hypothetical protein